MISGNRIGVMTLAMMLTAGLVRAGEPLVLAPGKGSVVVYGGSSSATHYYDLNGNMKRFDTLRTSFSAITFGVNANYGLVENLQADLELPIGYYSITSKERFPDRSIVAPAYLGLGLTYQFGRGRVNGSVSTMLKLPPGFHDGIYDDPNHPSFLSDGYMQLTSMLNFGFTADHVWFKGGAGYNWRAEEPSDEIIYRAEIGFSRVEGTGVFLGCQGVTSTADVSKPLRPFYAGASGNAAELERIDGGRGVFRTIDRESYFALNAGAFVSITDRIFVSGMYTIRLFGTNSLLLHGIYAATGYNF